MGWRQDGEKGGSSNNRNADATQRQPPLPQLPRVVTAWWGWGACGCIPDMAFSRAARFRSRKPSPALELADVAGETDGDGRTGDGDASWTSEYSESDIGTAYAATTFGERAPGVRFGTGAARRDVGPDLSSSDYESYSSSLSGSYSYSYSRSSSVVSEEGRAWKNLLPRARIKGARFGTAPRFGQAPKCFSTSSGSSSESYGYYDSSITSSTFSSSEAVVRCKGGVIGRAPRMPGFGAGAQHGSSSGSGLELDIVYPDPHVPGPQ